MSISRLLWGRLLIGGGLLIRLRDAQRASLRRPLVSVFLYDTRRSSHIMRKLMEKLRRLLRREPEGPPDDYAMAGAPKKPRLPGKSAAAAAPLD
jgi:hypothetical protein